MFVARVGVLSLASGALALAFTACGGGYGGSSNPAGPSGSSGNPLSVILRNSSASPIHMFVTGETRSDANLVAAAGSLTRTYTQLDRNNFNVEFVAQQPPPSPGSLGQQWGTSCRLAGSRTQQQVEVVYTDALVRCVGW